MTIKETSGKILLYFYQLQRTVPTSMQHRQLGFIYKKTGGVSLTSDKKWLTDNLRDINPAPTDIFNAFKFLLDKGFVQSRERANVDAKIYVGIHITHKGIDIVEGIEGGEEGRQAFNTAFNISVGSGSDVESLIKDTLGALSDD